MIFYYGLNRNQVLKPCMRQAVWEANNRYILHSYFPRRREYCWACWEPMSAVSPISSRDFAKSAAPQPKKGCRSDRQVWEWQSWSTSVGFESANGLKLWKHRHRQCEHPNAIPILGKDGESQDMVSVSVTGKSADHAEFAGHGQLNAQRCVGWAVELVFGWVGVWHVARGYDSSCCGLELWLDVFFFFRPSVCSKQKSKETPSLSLQSMAEDSAFSLMYMQRGLHMTSHLRTSKPQ